MYPPSENGVPQHEGMIVVPIPGPVDKGDRPLMGTATENVQRFCTLSEFIAVSAPELVPTFGIMAEPGAQLGAWGDLFHPVVEPSARLADATRPQAIDENSCAVRSCRRIVRALQPYVRSSDLWGDDSGYLRKTRGALRRNFALEFDFSSQACKVAVNYCHRELSAIAQIGD